MPILDPNSAQTFYDQILESHLANYTKPVNALRDFRLIFESIFKTITASEPQSFSNIFARTVFVIDKYYIPKNIADEIKGFRKYANDATHTDGFRIEEKKYLTALKALAITIHYLSNVPVPGEIEQIYKDKGSLTFSYYTPKVVETIELSKCVVRSIGPLKQADNGTNFFQLTCESDDDLGSFSINLWQTEHNDLTILLQQIWPYCSLNIINFKKIPTGENFYTSVPFTWVVIEPDFLIEASEIAECFQNGQSNPNLYLLSKLASSEANDAAFKGKLVNDHLDALIRQPDKTPDEVYQITIADNALKAARFGQARMAEIRSSIRSDHFNNLIAISKHYQGNHIKIEPTFFSSLYGLNGRLDALIEYESDPNRKEVFELKSGKAPYGNGLWLNNEMQVVCYNMLLRSTFGKNRTGNSSILYSAATENPLRNVVSNDLSELKVIQLRNKIISIVYRLSKDDTSHLSSLTLNDFGPAPGYTLKNVAPFEYAYSTASDLEKKYYHAFLSFIFREHQITKTGNASPDGRQDNGFASLWLDNLADKEKKFNILYGLKFKSFDTYDNSVSFEFTSEINHNFRDGDLGILYPKNNEILEPLKCQILKGNIKQLNSQKLIFSLRNKQLDEDFFRNHHEWVIEHDLYESNYWANTQSLFEFLKASQSLKDLILGIREPALREFPYEKSGDLVPNQHELVNNALCAKDYFLLQGPPGTGKTSTMLIRIATELVAKTTDNIVILAFTNRAVDEISKKLRQNNVHFLRLSSNKSAAEENLSNQIEGLSVGQIVTLIKDHRVFVSTVASFATRIGDLQEIVRLNTLIIDESSQLTEPQIVGLIPSFDRFILIGDQNQLPAVVAQSSELTKVSDPDLINAGVVDLSQSLFERLYNTCNEKGWSHAYGMLENHFRMHDDIANLINQYYNNKLTSDKPRQKEPFTLFSPTSTNPVEALLSASRTLFIQTGRHATSNTNTEEAIKVSAILSTIKEKLGAEFNSDTVGVVTPWRAQIALIKSHIHDPEILEKVAIDTVERFQGSEKRLIIASLAVYHPNQVNAMQSIDLHEHVDRKLLVTISRAQEQLIVLGYPPALVQSHFYRDMLEKIKSSGGFIDHRTGMQTFADFFKS